MTRGVAGKVVIPGESGSIVRPHPQSCAIYRRRGVTPFVGIVSLAFDHGVRLVCACLPRMKTGAQGSGDGCRAAPNRASRKHESTVFCDLVQFLEEGGELTGDTIVLERLGDL